RLMDSLGGVYLKLGLHAQAGPLLEKALEIRQRLLGPLQRETLASMNHLAKLRSAQSREAEAEKLIREALAGQERLLGPEDDETLTSVNDLAWTLMAQNKTDQSVE